MRRREATFSADRTKRFDLIRELPTIEQQIAELESAGWIKVRGNVWKAPVGGYFRGPLHPLPLAESRQLTANFIMLNPSVADENRDDPTIRKCIGFASRWGYSRIAVTNLIPLVCTDPCGLPPWRGFDMENWAIVERHMRDADLVVAAWGSQPRSISRCIAMPEYVLQIKELAGLNKQTIYCIGETRNGSPLHPSRAPYTVAPVIWEYE